MKLTTHAQLSIEDQSWATYIQRRNLINLDVSLNVPTLLIPVWGSECHAVPGSFGESQSSCLIPPFPVYFGGDDVLFVSERKG